MKTLKPKFKSTFSNAIADVKRLNKLDKKTTPLRFMKLTEELGELSNQYLIHTDVIPYKEKNLEELKGEMADVLQCVLSIYGDIEDQLGISIIDDVIPKVFEKNKKWESKINYKPMRKEIGDYKADTKFQDRAVQRLSDAGVGDMITFLEDTKQQHIAKTTRGSSLVVRHIEIRKFGKNEYVGEYFKVLAIWKGHVTIQSVRTKYCYRIDKGPHTNDPRVLIDKLNN